MPSAIPISWSPRVSASRGRPPARMRRPSAEQAEVSRADRPARTREQGEQGGVGGDVVEQVQGGDDLGDLGQPDQPGQADDLDGHVTGRQGVEHVGRVGVVAGEHADVGPLGPGLVSGADLVGQPGELVGLGRQHPRRHLSLTGVGLGGQADDLAGVLVVERLGQPVGHLEDAAVGAAADGERVRRDAPPTSRGREGVGEVEDVGHRRAAPAVDRLVGVTDRGHGVPAREQPRQHGGLGDGRVLVLVEEHHREPLALHHADVGLLHGEPGAQLDLVGVVHQPEVALEPAVSHDEVHQLATALDGVDRLRGRLEVGLAALAGLLLLEREQEGGLGLAVELEHVLGADEVLAHRAVEGEEVLDRGRRVVGQEPHLGRVPLDHPRAELVARRVREHAGVGLVADAQAVVGQQAGGVGVVGRHGRLDGLVAVRARLGQQPGGQQRLADLGAELARGLGRERQAQHLVGPHLLGRDEVDDPGGHQGGLARPGPGDHDGRLERRPDGLPLLGAGREVPAASGRPAPAAWRSSPGRHRPGALDRADRTGSRSRGSGRPRPRGSSPAGPVTTRAPGGRATRRARGRRRGTPAAAARVRSRRRAGRAGRAPPRRFRHAHPAPAGRRRPGRRRTGRRRAGRAAGAGGRWACPWWS